LKDRSLNSLLRRIWKVISKRRKFQFGLLLILILLCSFMELVSIGAALPFIAILTSPEMVFEHPVGQFGAKLLGLTTPEQLLAPITILFAIAAIIAGAMRVVLLYINIRVSYATGADLSLAIYRLTLYQSYVDHSKLNSSHVINSVINKANGCIHSTILPFVTLVSSIILLITIITPLLFLTPKVTFFVLTGFALIYAVIMKSSHKIINKDSDNIAVKSTLVIKAVQEGLGGIRDVIVNGNQDLYCNIYRDSDLALRKAQGNINFISNSPRFLLEALGLVLIAFLGFFLSQQSGSITNAIPILGTLAMAAQRLLPALQQAYSSWTTMRGGQASLRDALETLELPQQNHNVNASLTPIPFQHSLEINNVSFSYSQNLPNILKGINLKIDKGSRVGIIGKTGSGKSTLTDIIMGLLEPSSGRLLVDNHIIEKTNLQAWRAHISHVPQDIFLADSTIKENIAFGINPHEIDHERVVRAASQAQINKTIEGWDKRYNTLVGERGAFLSGGQRQRIGIARALYRKSDLIILDEATSALDYDTEKYVMEAVECLSKELTLVIVAHRITTLKHCDIIIELSDGKVKRLGQYETFLK
jgi:ATP-binding cassette, subfamily B, bacterial PglK